MKSDPTDSACVYLRNIALIPCCVARTHGVMGFSWNDSVLHSQSADEAKRKRRCDVVLEISRRSEEQTLKRRRRGGDSAESHCSPADAIWNSVGRLCAYIQLVARNQQKRKRSSSRHESAGAKQLTIYEELRELDVNC
ncbi:importin subunit alpha [Dorcoceras hygrometricum]|uniref:Importin subunit alpha n=1 Tax=Dorcoceras hygrometricum TaxID=472368 RepID=A0A2Z7A3R0_9LAMI|nr:importin subunit alpha [Dorcoceras hygrometricum]